MPPNKTLATTRTAGIKGDKTRLTYLFGCNADGSDKLEPLVIGHAFRPRCFGRKSADHWGFNYTANRKAWMTASICGDWLEDLDQRMIRERRKILLLFDNFSGHNLAVKTVKLTNITVHFFPPNMTSVLQPCNVGVIRAFKAHYRRSFISQAIGKYEDNPEMDAKDIYHINQLEAMFLARHSWDSISSQTITNCFQHTGIIAALSQGVDPKSELVDPHIESEVSKLQMALRKLHKCQRLEESKKVNCISISQLLNPEVETQPPEAEVVMPSDVEIVQTTAAGEALNPVDIDETEEIDAPRIPWSLQQARKAIEELQYLFRSRPTSGNSAFQKQILALTDMMSNVNQMQLASMKQPKITGFFATKISVDDVVTESKDGHESGQVSDGELPNSLF